MPRPTSQDLAGFWDLLQLSIEDVSMKFDELHQLKLNDWKIIESPERKVSRPWTIPFVVLRSPSVKYNSGTRLVSNPRNYLIATAQFIHRTFIKCEGFFPF